MGREAYINPDACDVQADASVTKLFWMSVLLPKQQSWEVFGIYGRKKAGRGT